MTEGQSMRSDAAAGDDAARAQAHLVLVSAQPTPNLTPVLDPAVRPARVVLLVSPDMEQRADWLAAVLVRRGVRVDRWPVEQAWNLEHVQFRVLELLESEPALVERGGIALNVTGGTKLMAIAAFDVFRAYALPIFYVHPGQDRLIWLHPSERPGLDLADRLRLDDFLAAHGATLIAREDAAVPVERRALTDWLVAQNERIGRQLGTLNWLAGAAEGTLLSPALDRRQTRDAALAELLGRFADAELLRVEGDRLRFPDEPARFYVNGGWLEGHVYAVLRELRGEVPQMQDLARSVQIVRAGARGEAVPNELDVLSLVDNRLYTVECKTRQWGDSQVAGPGANALYRLDSLGDLLGGLLARTMLVSYRVLPDHVLTRAADLRIEVCAGGRLPELPAVLRRWIDPARRPPAPGA
ncbi:Card1-like endonuclease domain-containing protein [Thiohalocapsa sp. ML1]|uniref:Card1-like endonuclease domain-containing protein n=1 Tax=Thiohalocapsa sp. ML1 TaxID=1431688 RepID=UPI00073220FB|nr:DUF1887 family CARF protein [Thiohalocapsa sp. ML1]